MPTKLIATSVLFDARLALRCRVRCAEPEVSRVGAGPGRFSLVYSGFS